MMKQSNRIKISEMKKILTFILIAGFFGLSPAFAQDCTNCFDDGPNGCGKLGYWDGDGDGFGSGSQMCFFGANPSNYAPKGNDCNDNNATIFPRRFYYDSDGDGFGSSISFLICSGPTPPANYSTNNNDCDDGDPNITVAKYWFQDYDNDSYGDSSTQTYGCTPPVGMANPVLVGGDFDDSTGNITNVQPRTFYFDGDGDGFGISSNTVYQSFPTGNYVEDSGDCNDSNSNINPETVWFLDSDGDGLGSSTPLNKVQCTQPPNDANGSYVLSNTDLCPNEFGSQANNGCTNLSPLAVTDNNKNWVWSINYDPKGTIIGNSINYFGDLGKGSQTQSIDIKTGKIWANQTLYDSEGMPAFQTLGAPIGAPAQFTYKDDFVRKTDGSTYSKSDFETNPESPTIVGEQANSLGWYYSDGNSSEPYQDASDYPFSRTIYSKLNPGTPLKNLGGNKVNGAWPQSYSFTMPATDELSQTITSSTVNYSNYKMTKTVTRDVHGVENVVFVDADGKTLAAARSGEGSISSYMRLNIGIQGYVDVHVPKGITGIVVSNSSLVTIYDLITEQSVATSASSLGNGFYRIAVNNLDTYTPNSIYVDYKVNYYDHSLNEYDDAGRLIASYQPLNLLKTEYKYNALGQLIYTKSPDEGEAWFKYREDGQIRYSQNSKQKLANEFSYTNYDEFGRPDESGVVESTAFDTIDPDDNSANTPAGVKKEQLYTTYDVALNTLSCASAICAAVAQRGGQAFVNGNVAMAQNDQSITYYSYDAYGRVTWLVQNITGLGVKTIDYTYDPVTGLVTLVDFQKNDSSERFIHRYTYNELDQLIRVETSTNASTYTTHAEYEYYETGTLKRVEYAGGIQGVDYVYNLSGQLKGINHPNIGNANLDPGGDSNDLFGMQVDYNNADYQRTMSNIEATVYGADQLNGNIKGIRWNNALSFSDPSVYAYSYDRNNWLTGADYGTFIGTGNSNAPTTYPDSGTYTSSSGAIVREATQSITLGNGFHAQSGSNYHAYIVDTNGFEEVGNGDYDVTGIEYDPNGNITQLVRKKNDSGGNNDMDDLSYVYKANTNQLLRVDDADGDVAGTDDIGDQNGTNYTYNSIGQLTNNAAEGVSYSYNVQGLVTEVQKNGQPVIKLYYNERGQRIKKETYGGGNLQKTDIYVRDAGGTAMAIYSNGTLLEHTIYGSERLGVYQRAGATSVYQLTDHLGNVRATFQKSGSTIVNDDYNDYYPFGMPMPGRNGISSSAYRYAFQGQEKDPETNKEAFELRLWDSRIGRWLTTDPAGQYSSPYLGMGNNPISRVDPDGGFDWVYDKEKKEYVWIDSAVDEKTTPFGYDFVGDHSNITDDWISRSDGWFDRQRRKFGFNDPTINWDSYKDAKRNYFSEFARNAILAKRKHVLAGNGLVPFEDLYFDSRYVPPKDFTNKRELANVSFTIDDITFTSGRMVFYVTDPRDQLNYVNNFMGETFRDYDPEVANSLTFYKSGNESEFAPRVQIQLNTFSYEILYDYIYNMNQDVHIKN